MKYKIDSCEEKEYLENYHIDQFERPSVAVDVVTFAVMKDGEQNNIRKLAKRELKILLIKGAQFPYKGAWVLPGGFVKRGEILEKAAERESNRATYQEKCPL